MAVLLSCCISAASGRLHSLQPMYLAAAFLPTQSIRPCQSVLCHTSRWQSTTPNISGTEKSKLEKARRLAKKKTASQLVTVRAGPTFHLDEAIRVLKSVSTSATDQTVDIQIQLGIDPRKTDQTVRGVAQLPHGTGKKVLVAVFAKGDKAEEARKAGAYVVGAEDLVDRISKGLLDFNKTIATPDMMPLVGKVARILGPRGLMPNPKLGTVTVAIKEAVAAAKRGQATFRAEKRGIVSAAVGKLGFPALDLRDNVRSFMSALVEAKPDGFKGNFLRAAYLSSTHGPGIPLDIAVLDPLGQGFMGKWNGTPSALSTTSTKNLSAPSKALPATVQKSADADLVQAGQ